MVTVTQDMVFVRQSFLDTRNNCFVSELLDREVLHFVLVKLFIIYLVTMSHYPSYSSFSAQNQKYVLSL